MIEMLGYQVASVPATQCVDDILSGIADQTRPKRWLACINPHSYAVALGDSRFETALKRADILVPDGAGIVLASRILHRPVAERVTGFDIFDGVMRGLDASGGRVFFLGSTPSTLAAIQAKVALDYPGITAVDVYSPPFKPDFSDEDTAAMIAAVNAAKPDVLWVGMTAPKQEKWLADMTETLDARFSGAIGAVFDFYVGNVKRSHPIFQRMGLEWLPRLVQQPRRLWRRTFISAPIFLRDVLVARLSFAAKPGRNKE